MRGKNKAAGRLESPSAPAASPDRDEAEAASGFPQEILLPTLLATLPDNIYFKDRESRFVLVSRSLLEKFGLKDPSEALGKTDFDFFTKEHASKAFEDEQELLRTGEPLIDCVEKETWADGRTTWGSTTKLCLYDQDGEAIGTFGVTRDVTDRMEAENALKSSEARMRAILQHAADGIVTFDKKGVIKQMNPAAERIFGYRAEEIFDKGMRGEMTLPRGVMKKILEANKLQEGGTALEIDGTRKDGTEFPMELMISEVVQEDGRMFIALIRDITERKAAEKAVNEARKAAEEANRAKSEFLANMSHEIRTPMNGIIGMTELLLATDLTKDQRQYLNLVSHSADSLLSLINDILDFSKIEAGKFELDHHEFELRDAVGDTLHTLGFRAAEKGLELAYQVQSNVPDTLVGDLGRVRQILVNLVGNALKFTHEGEVVVDVQLVPDSLTGKEATLHFLVKDTGIGIPPEKQKSIFDSFAQAESSTTRAYGGTGLGLTISCQLVEMMNGRLWVESEPGEGSIFHFTATFGLGSEKPAAARLAPETLNGLRVLVVDDNDTNRVILHNMLQSWEMKPAIATAGGEALEKLESASSAGQPFQLVLLDGMMPEMDGIEVARRAIEKFGDDAPPVLLLSSAGEPFSVEKLASLGIGRALTKPVKQSELLDAITRLFGTATRNEHPASIESRPVEVPPMKVLLAEDGRVNQMVAIKMLEDRGHSVVLATNGRQALDALEREDFDAVLMDVQMPEMDGFEATGAIRKEERAAGSGTRLPIIAMTANAMKGDREKCLEAGMDDYVAKPVRSAELFATLEKFASGETTGPAPEPESEPFPCESSPPFDAAAFQDSMGDDDLMNELIDIFGEDADDFVVLAREALANGDADALHHAAHSLKGLVGNYFAAPAFEAAARLDGCAREGDLESAGEQLTRVEREVERLKSDLADFRETLRT